MEAEDRQDAAEFERCMQYVRAHATGELEGLHGPNSVTWTTLREPLVLAGGFAAVLLQLAHPAVAAGVGQYSSFAKDLIGRARRTFTSMYELLFGTLTESMAASRRLFLIHRRVRGVVEEPGAPSPGPFRANEQRLLRWVGATTSFAMNDAFERLVRPLTPEEWALFHPEYVLRNAAVGVLPETQPKTLEALVTWYAHELESPELEVGPTALGIADALFNSKYTRGPFDEILTAGLLPPRFREAYKLRWGKVEQRSFAVMVGGLRATRSLLPEPYTHVVAWHQANLRIARAQFQPESRWARVLNAIDKRVDLPTSLKPIAPDVVVPSS